MFLINKYSKYYNQIIFNAKKELRDKKNSYYEAHHIIPKCLGGTNKRENIINLTAREHFICHLLLIKMFKVNSNEYYKMLHAFMLMKGENLFQIRYINSKLYESIKIKYSKYRSEKLKGTKLSEEHKRKIGNSNRGHVTSEETKKKISIAASTRKRKPFSDEYKRKMSEIMKVNNKHTKKKLVRPQ